MVRQVGLARTSADSRPYVRCVRHEVVAALLDNRREDETPVRASGHPIHGVAGRTTQV